MFHFDPVSDGRMAHVLGWLYTSQCSIFITWASAGLYEKDFACRNRHEKFISRWCVSSSHAWEPFFPRPRPFSPQKIAAPFSDNGVKFFLWKRKKVIEFFFWIAWIYNIFVPSFEAWAKHFKHILQNERQTWQKIESESNLCTFYNTGKIK